MVCYCSCQSIWYSYIVLCNWKKFYVTVIVLCNWKALYVTVIVLCNWKELYVTVIVLCNGRNCVLLMLLADLELCSRSAYAMACFPSSVCRLSSVFIFSHF